MILLTEAQKRQLLANGAATAAALDAGQDPPDHYPVVKLFTPDAACTWLLSEIDPDAPDIAFGLCDLGMQCAELGSVSLSEIRSLRGRLGLPVERDLGFKAKHPISVYARAAWRRQAITLDPRDLDMASKEDAS